MFAGVHDLIAPYFAFSACSDDESNNNEGVDDQDEKKVYIGKKRVSTKPFGHIREPNVSACDHVCSSIALSWLVLAWNEVGAEFMIAWC